MTDPILNRHSREDGKPDSTSSENLITQHIDIWTTAIERKSSAGRGTSNKFTLYGIKKLRELILELAVRGKLVPQDPNDEPASVLLERIAAEKAQLVKYKKIKKPKPLPEIGEDEKPFELPMGWEWSRVNELSKQVTDGVHHTPKYIESGVPFISVKDIDGKTVSFVDCKYISQEQHEEINQRCNPEFGDILLCRIGTLGRATIVDTSEPFSLFVSVGLLKFFNEALLSEYLHRVFHSPLLLRQYDDIKAGGSHTNKLNLGDIPRLWIPVAPLKEQHRIVAKVDELMSLCDALEAQTEASLSAHQTLVETLLNVLLLPNTTQPADSQSASPEPVLNESFIDSWQCVAEHFDTLFTTEASIDTLKKTILQLAVMGKLVPQDENDEPAAKLLDRMAAEKAQLIADKKIKKQKPLPAITDEEKPFELPVGWSFLRLENMCELITKGSSPKWQGVSYTENPEDVLFVTSENVGAFKMLLDKKKYVERKFNEIEPRSILKKNDFLMNIVGASIGRCAIFDLNEVANINQAVCLIRSFPNSIASKFFLHFFNSHTCIAYMYDKQVENARPNLSMSNIAKFIIPIPPLEEQHRIVAKVDELMTLCDQLKARLSDAQTTQLHLTDAIVEQAI